MSLKTISSLRSLIREKHHVSKYEVVEDTLLFLLAAKLVQIFAGEFVLATDMEIYDGQKIAEERYNCPGFFADKILVNETHATVAFAPPCFFLSFS